MNVRKIVGFVLVTLLVAPMPILAQRPSMTVLQRSGSFILRTKRTKEQKKRLQPNPQDISRYQQFLSQPRTGIFRLMPDTGCTENVNVIKADAVCLQYIPESSYYSFREKEHTIEMLADIRLRNGFLITDGVLSQGILVRLGDTELEKTDLQAQGMEYLTGFSPQVQGLDVQQQFLQLMRGVKVGDFEYKKAVPMVVNNTYALRAIAYRGNIYRSFRGYKFDVLEGDKRIDMTIAFRVVRKDTDGGITLVWKELERRDSPRIIFPKRKR